jgi:hypothetical protein
MPMFYLYSKIKLVTIPNFRINIMNELNYIYTSVCLRLSIVLIVKLIMQLTVSVQCKLCILCKFLLGSLIVGCRLRS